MPTCHTKVGKMHECPLTDLSYKSVRRCVWTLLLCVCLLCWWVLALLAHSGPRPCSFTPPPGVNVNSPFL